LRRLRHVEEAVSCRQQWSVASSLPSTVLHDIIVSTVTISTLFAVQPLAIVRASLEHTIFCAWHIQRLLPHHVPFLQRSCFGATVRQPPHGTVPAVDADELWTRILLYAAYYATVCNTARRQPLPTLSIVMAFAMLAQESAIRRPGPREKCYLTRSTLRVTILCDSSSLPTYCS